MTDAQLPAGGNASYVEGVGCGVRFVEHPKWRRRELGPIDANPPEHLVVMWQDVTTVGLWRGGLDLHNNARNGVRRLSNRPRWGRDQAAGLRQGGVNI